MLSPTRNYNMSNILSPTNPAYEFVHYVAKQYDKKVLKNSKCSKLARVCKKGCLDELPKGVQGVIYCLASENFCSLLHNTKQLRFSPFASSDTVKVSTAAEKFLAKMPNQLNLTRSGTPIEKCLD